MSLYWVISSNHHSAPLTLKMKTDRSCLMVFTNVASRFFWHHPQHNSVYKKAMLLLNLLCYLATTDKGSDIFVKLALPVLFPFFLVSLQVTLVCVCPYITWTLQWKRRQIYTILCDNFCFVTFLSVLFFQHAVETFGIHILASVKPTSTLISTVFLCQQKHRTLTLLYTIRAYSICVFYPECLIKDD